MGKGRRGNKGNRSSVNIQNKSVLGSDDEALYSKEPNEKNSDYYYDEIDKFHQEKEKILLEEEDFAPSEPFDNQEEVYGLQDDDDDDDDDDDEDGLPDIKAWGKKKSKFYNTDYIDNDYLGYKEEDAEAAQAEEEELLALQKRLDDEIEESDFGMDWFEKKYQNESKNEEIPEKIEMNLEALNEREKLEFLQKNSPEQKTYIEDFKSRLSELTQNLQPAWKLIEEKKLPEGCWTDYVTTKYQTILQYCTNISFYMMLKTNKEPVNNHPVMSRLHTYKKLLEKLDSVEHHYMPIIEKLINGIDISLILEQEEDISNKNEVEEIAREFKMPKEMEKMEDSTLPLTDDENEEEEEEGMETYQNDSLQSIKSNEEKRSITYDIAKNKGLTPYRKKDVRNPRVRHRRKYERAKVKRKGQYREPIKELQRYGGEISGIRAGVSKSIKLK